MKRRYEMSPTLQLLNSLDHFTWKLQWCGRQRKGYAGILSSSSNEDIVIVRIVHKCIPYTVHLNVDNADSKRASFRILINQRSEKTHSTTDFYIVHFRDEKCMNKWIESSPTRLILMFRILSVTAHSNNPVGQRHVLHEPHRSSWKQWQHLWAKCMHACHAQKGLRVLYQSRRSVLRRSGR